MSFECITNDEVAELISQNSPLFLLDVRTPEEHQAFNIGGTLIPIDQLADRLAEIPTHLPIVVYCRSGHRSHLAMEFLRKNGFADVKNLTGGMLAWKLTPA